jgi:hypothetical protein
MLNMLLTAGASAEEVEKQLGHMAKAALAKIQLSQIESAIPKASDEQWVIDLPYKDGSQLQELQFRFTRKRHTEKEEDANNWQVVFDLDMSWLGSMRVVIQLKNEKISVHFYPDQESTENVLNSEFNKLHDRLTAQDIEVLDLIAARKKK